MPPTSLRHVVNTHIMQCHYLSTLIAIMWYIQTPQLVQLMNIVSNLIYHCNNCNANRAFITICESTAAGARSGLLNANLRLRGRPPPITYIRIDRRMNALRLRRWWFSYKKHCSRLSSSKVCENGRFAFLCPLRGLRDNVQCLSWAHWKARSGLPISVKLQFFP